MSKPLVLVTAPITTRSGYGNHARDIVRALIELDKYDIKINACKWGNTPMNALEDNNTHHQKIKSRILPDNKLDRQPDLHFHIVICFAIRFSLFCYLCFLLMYILLLLLYCLF